jgi:uncharacterized protein YndB with AHSA1/START domain/DNA-binding transcriptional ArsR family regulator
MMAATATETSLDQTLAALADPTRRAILRRLAQGEARVTELARPFAISLNSVSKHIRTLERARLVRRRRAGREHLLSFDAAPLGEAAAWIEAQRAFWSARLDALERELNILKRRQSEERAMNDQRLSAMIVDAQQAMNEFGVVTEARTVRIRRVLPGPIERVWAYLTESEKRAKWLASGEMDLRVGGRVELTFRHSGLSPHPEPIPDKYRKYEGTGFEGRITRCEPPRLLSYTWGDCRRQQSEVTFELTPEGQKVLLVLTHRRLDDRAKMVSASSGWHIHLGILEDLLEGRSPRIFWSTYTRLEAEYERRLPAE